MKIRVGIIGGAGYTAGELIRLLINHPNVEIVFVNSQSNAGNKIIDIHGGLIGECDLTFSDSENLDDIDCLFMCSGHGHSKAFWQEHVRPEGLKVVDLAQDFRDESCGYVYGLPEINRERISQASLVANPGCFATAIQLALLPFIQNAKGAVEINVTGITGSTGAGVKPGATTHFSWRDNNLSVYKPFTHQHLIEIGYNFSKINPEAAESKLNFVPMRGDFPRGIFVTAFADSDLSEEELVELYKKFYAGAAFTFVSDRQVDLKQAVNTNKCILKVEKHGSKVLVTSVIDNLLKGASGQAVQNMNLMFGLDEKTGLRLKPSAF